MKKVSRIKQCVYTLVGLFGLIASAVANDEHISLEFPPMLESDYPRDNFSSQIVSETAFTLSLQSAVEMISLPKIATTLNGKTVYGTNLDGVGVSLSLNGQEINEQGNIPTAFSAQDQLIVSAQLVLYKALEAGQYTVEQSPFINLQLADKRVILLDLSPIQLNIKKRSCSLVNQNQTINLNTALQNDLWHKGSEVFGGQFSLNLECDPKVSARVTFFDQSDFNNRSDILNLDPVKSTAKGVGLRLYRNSGQAVEFGHNWLFSENEIRPSQNFLVHYINRDGKVSPGTVNATATVTFTYH